MKLFYKQYGDSKPALFILHGIFGMLDNWHNIAKLLSTSYTVYSIDARNHGKSPHSMEMGFNVMVEDIIELANDLNIDKFILMGHSMGGKTAMLLADMYPERVDHLIVVDIAPKAYKPSHTTYFNAFEEIQWNNLNSRKEIDEALLGYESNIGVRLFLAKNVDRLESGGFEVKSNIPALKLAYNEIIGHLPLHSVYEGPALFITGEKSHYLIESDKPYILEHFAKAQFNIVSNAGHWVHADNPSEFLTKLTAFLNPTH
ncbi:MAG: alpha/beta fold hydrolase [Bacteroidia bacterium]|nr:alpha/beta fold hydrolase [Bacteroidia bacterium]